MEEFNHKNILMEDQHRKTVANELIGLIERGNAHASFEDAVKDININLLNEIPGNLPYSLWQLTEHIRIAQWDIVEFCIDQQHQSPKWPDEYWPGNSKINTETWTSTIRQIGNDRERFISILKDPANDLYAPFAHGNGQNLFREALLIADHTAYHTGEIIIVRRLLNDWK
jgi:hypothetical protein